MWAPPPALIDKRRLKGAPQHGIGRSCKAGKEEIAGLLTALKLFIAEGDKTRHARWLALLQSVESGLGRTKGVAISLSGAEDTDACHPFICRSGRRGVQPKWPGCCKGNRPPFMLMHSCATRTRLRSIHVSHGGAGRVPGPRLEEGIPA